MKTCLIVDDSKTVRSITANILKDLGLNSLQAENGAIALEMCKKEMPDVVVLDWHMPVMDGYECLQGIRKLPDESQPIVIFCTSMNDEDHIFTAINAGANEFIMKPFDHEIMRLKLESLGII